MSQTLTPEDHESSTMVIIKAMEAREKYKAAETATFDAAANRAKQIKTIAGAVIFFASLIGGAAVTFKELQDKPTDAEVQEAIETTVAPVRVQAAKADENAAVMEEIRGDVERVKSVQDYQIEQSSWQGDVLQHVAEKKRSKPPPKPESLKKKERELLRK